MKKIYASFILALFIGYAWGQSSIGISKTGNMITDTFSSGDSLRAYVWVKNYGPQPTGQFSCQINYAFMDSSGAPGIYAADTFTVNLNVNDSTLITNAHTPNTQGLKYGINIIVIWPVAPGNGSILTHDTLYQPILLVSGVGIAKIDASKLIQIYPNPTTDKVVIHTGDNIIRSVGLFDQAGRLIQVWDGNVAGIDCGILPKGMYLLKIQTADRSEPVLFKVLKQ